jgi:hypothetical protein
MPDGRTRATRRQRAAYHRAPMLHLRYLVLLVVLGCGAAAHPPRAPALPDACDAAQAAIRAEADARAAPYSAAAHLAKNFADHQIAWLMPEAAFQKYIVATAATRFGRCTDAGCFLFASPGKLIHAAVAAARTGAGHDPAVLGRALGLPADRLAGPLRMMTLDLATPGVCARLPVDADPGVWPCKTADDHDCFKFGGYTSGGVPELMVIGAPVAATAVEAVP